ncbi:MAG: ABC transporter ATP-binding protein [Pseudomonadota bacterium]
MIHLDAVSRRLGDFVVDSIDLVVEDRAYLVLLGPSGAGKSVLLHLLAGFEALDSGRILVDGTDFTALPPERRQIGLVQQQPALFPHHSVLGNLAFGLRARGVGAGERQRRIDDIVALLHLGPLRQRPVATLSGGEAQRVALARALVTRPRVLLLDEPLAPIDHNARLELQAELRRVHDALQLTTVHVTHSRDEARALASHVAVMHAGRLIQSGPVDDVWERPRCLFVARFLGVDAKSVPALEGCSDRCLQPGGACAFAGDLKSGRHRG